MFDSFSLKLISEEDKYDKNSWVSVQNWKKKNKKIKNKKIKLTILRGSNI
jgi:hypothetical protein